MRDGAAQGWVSLGGSGGWIALGTHGTDFSGDGWDDILFVNDVTGAVGYREMRDGAVSGWTTLGVADGHLDIDGPFWAIMGTGDYANDGAADVLWYSFTTGATGLWANDGSGAAQWSSLGVVDQAWEPAWLDADYTGDGADDVLWYSYDETGAVDVGLWDLSSGQAVWTYIGRATAGWDVISAGDFTGDGTADVVLMDFATGDVGYWELDAGAVYAGWTAIGVDYPTDTWEVLG